MNQIIPNNFDMEYLIQNAKNELIKQIDNEIIVLKKGNNKKNT